MQGTRRWNKGVAVVIGALAFIFAPLQNAIAQSLTLDENIGDTGKSAGRQNDPSR
jgi:hypothetical protein